MTTDDVTVCGRCPPYINVPSYCVMVVDPNDACCKRPVCANPVTATPVPNPFSTPNPNPVLTPAPLTKGTSH